MSEANAIVYPTDFSDASLAAIPWAKRLASVLGAELHCLFVVEEPYIVGPIYGGVVPMPSGTELAEAIRPKMDEFAKQHFSSLDGKATTKVLIGHPADAIVEYAKTQNAAMIIMTTHGYSGVKHIILGSTTEAVLRQAGCPVLSIRSE